MFKMFAAALATVLVSGSLAFAQQHHHQHHHAPAPNNKFVPAKPVVRPHGVHPVAPVHAHRWQGQNYHLRFGRPFKHGYFYHGFRHNHWSHHYWDRRYGAYLYYDPFTLAWYYWCAPHYRYYPVSYVPLGTYAFPYVANPTVPATPVPPPPPVDQNPPAPPGPPPMPPAGP